MPSRHRTTALAALVVAALLLESAALQAQDASPAGEVVTTPPTTAPAGETKAKRPPKPASPEATERAAAAKRAAEAKQASAKAIDAAVDALLKEYRDAAKAGGVPTRTKSDYFGAQPPPGVTPDAVLAAVAKSVDRNASVDAYVRWQLLSGLPAKVDAAQAPQLLSVYRTAPRVRPMPGATDADRQRLDQELAGTRREAAYWSEAVAEGIRLTTAANRTVLAFRDELFARLPDSADVLVAGLADAYDRTAAGLAEGRGHMDAVNARIGAWSAAGGEAKQMAGIADLLAKLRNDKGTEYYESAAANKTAVRWVKKRVRFDADPLEATEQLLRQRATDAARTEKEAKATKQARPAPPAAKAN